MGWDCLGADFSDLAFRCDGIGFHSAASAIGCHSPVANVLRLRVVGSRTAVFMSATVTHSCAESAFQAHFFIRLLTVFVVYWVGCRARIAFSLRFLFL